MLGLCALAAMTVSLLSLTLYLNSLGKYAWKVCDLIPQGKKVIFSNSYRV